MNSLAKYTLEGHFNSRTRLFYRLAAVFFLVCSAPSLMWATSWNFTINLDAPGTGVTPPQNCSGGNHPDIVTVTADSIYQAPQPLSTDLRVTWNTESRDACQGRNIPGGGYYYYVLYLINNGATPQAPTVPTDGQPPNAGPWQFFIHHVNSCCGENVGGIDDLGTIQNLAAQSGVTGPPYVLWIGGLVDGFYWNNPNSPGTPNPLSVPLHITDDGKAPNVVVFPTSGTYSVSALPAPTVTINDDNPVASSYTITYTGANPCGTAPQATGFFNGSTPLIYNPALPSVCGPGTYTMNIQTVDAGNNTTISVASYTLVDLTPTNLVGKAVTDTAIRYTWTPSSATVGHYELWLNDPANALPPVAATQTISGLTSSFTMDYAGINPPFNLTSIPSNFFSSATLKACLEAAPPGCTGAGLSNIAKVYTLADPITGSSPTPFVSTATVSFDPANNSLNPGVNAPFAGTLYKVFYSSVNFQTSPQLATGSPASAPATIKLNNLQPNSAYNYYIDTYNGDGIQAVPVPLPSAAPFWTLPNAPGAVINPTVTGNSITANFQIPASPAINPPATPYVLEASADSNFSINVPLIQSTPPLTQQAPGTISTATISVGVAPGSTYFLRACAVSLKPAANHATDDRCGPISAPITTGIQAGTLSGPPNCPTATSITASWIVKPQPNVAGLQAIANSAGGALSGTVSTAPVSNPTITVTPLTSNTFYTLILQHIDVTSVGGLTAPLPYPGSDTPGMTYAATPGTPTLASSGTASSLAVTVLLPTDTNSNDSLYAVQILLPNGGGVGYLTGLTGGTTVSALSATPVWLTSAKWMAGPNAPNQLLGVLPNTTYSASLQLQQNITSAFIPAGCPAANPVLASGVASITTPGSILLQSFTTASGITLDSVPWGVPTNAPILAVFNLPLNDSINPSSITGKISIAPLTGMGTGTNLCTGASICGTVSGSTVTISPPGGIWQANTAYTVALAPGISDTFGFASTGTASSFFVTVPPFGTASPVVSPLDPGSLVTVGVPATAIVSGGGGFVVPRLQGTVSSTLFFGTLSNLGMTQSGALQIKNSAEVDIFHCSSGCNPSASDNPLTLTMTTRGATTGAFRNIDPNTLGIYTLGPQGILVPVPNSTFNAATGVAQAPITQSGIYYLAGAIFTQLNGAYAYPVPFKPALGHTVITFKGLATDAVIKIYTITGEEVARISYPNDGTNQVIWNVTNEDGDRVASGVYVYQIKNSFSEQRGKLIIIR